MLLDLDLYFRGFWCLWIKLLVFGLLREGECERGRGERGGRKEERGKRKRGRGKRKRGRGKERERGLGEVRKKED